MFLYGGSGSVSEVEEVVGALVTGVLRYSAAWTSGQFDMMFYDQLFNGNVAPRFELDWREQMFYAEMAEHEDDEFEDVDYDGKNDGSESSSSWDNSSKDVEMADEQSVAEVNDGEKESGVEDRLIVHKYDYDSQREGDQISSAERDEMAAVEVGHVGNQNASDVLEEYLPEFALIETMNQPWFRNLVWRLREPGHW